MNILQRLDMVGVGRTLRGEDGFRFSPIVGAETRTAEEITLLREGLVEGLVRCGDYGRDIARSVAEDLYPLPATAARTLASDLREDR